MTSCFLVYLVKIEPPHPGLIFFLDDCFLFLCWLSCVQLLNASLHFGILSKLSTRCKFTSAIFGDSIIASKLVNVEIKMEIISNV